MSEQVSVSVVEDAVGKFLKSMENAESFSVNDVVAFVNQNAALPPAERKERVERDIELILEGRSDIFFNSTLLMPSAGTVRPFSRERRSKSCRPGLRSRMASCFTVRVLHRSVPTSFSRMSICFP